MADDASYNTFLAKANQDPNSNAAQNQSTSQARSKFDPTTADSSAIPAGIRDIKTTYTSETDSEFEPVFFSYASHELPSKSDFEKLLGTKATKGNVEELSVKQFDPRGQYGDVIDKVKSVGTGVGVKIFRVELDHSRVEYYIVTVGERKLVGVVAKAVES